MVPIHQILRAGGSKPLQPHRASDTLILTARRVSGISILMSPLTDAVQRFPTVHIGLTGSEYRHTTGWSSDAPGSIHCLPGRVPGQRCRVNNQVKQVIGIRQLSVGSGSMKSNPTGKSRCFHPFTSHRNLFRIPFDSNDIELALTCDFAGEFSIA